MKNQLVILTVAAAALGASLFANSNYKNGQDLTGSWRLQVDIPPGSSACPPGGGSCVFLALASASADGTVIQTAALPGVSTGHGVWTRSGQREFTIRSSYFRFGPTGFPVGTAETTSTVALSTDGRQAAGSYINRILDLDGNDIGGFAATVSATRVEP